MAEEQFGFENQRRESRYTGFDGAEEEELQSARKSSVFEGFGALSLQSDQRNASKTSTYDGFANIEDEGVSDETGGGMWVIAEDENSSVGDTTGRVSMVDAPKPLRRTSSTYRRSASASSIKVNDIRADFEEKLQEIKLRSESGFKSKVTLDDLVLGRVIGEGSFGTVLVCEPANPSDTRLKPYMALKRQAKKSMMENKKELEHLRNEKDLMFAMRHDHLVSCVEYFQDVKYVYYLLELCNGGELWSIIRMQKKGRLSSKIATYWLAQTFLGLEYMHTMDICYRDLKPENLLVDYRGYMKITDFGFAKQFTSVTYTTCGTPEYMAPEIINSRGYNHAVDWWAFGVLAFEMCAGYAPFEDENQLKAFNKIKHADYDFPSHFGSDLKSFIDSFLTIDPLMRMGTHLFEGSDLVRKMALFKNIKWPSLETGTLPSPYKTKVKGMGDVSPFDEYDPVKVKWYGDGPDKYGDTFKGFG